MYLEAILVTEEYRKFKSKKYINFPEKFNLRELLLSVATHNYIMKYLIFCMGSVFCDKIEYLGFGKFIEIPFSKQQVFSFMFYFETSRFVF
ncbi:hypothetical protein [Leptospira interrogans]|uniref:Uncharacterized protein n=1 Tax=Leptospira interrogans serovar Bataviae TaxID=312175 RepID=A0AAQ0B3W6_LEPIR|nr:hypothetical protein [Leptospira interrogans]QOI52028.1 hypothetical protein Lepto1489_17450 [Leptospira interrogans serovar Bataviae]